MIAYLANIFSVNPLSHIFVTPTICLALHGGIFGRGACFTSVLRRIFSSGTISPMKRLLCLEFHASESLVLVATLQPRTCGLCRTSPVAQFPRITARLITASSLDQISRHRLSWTTTPLVPERPGCHNYAFSCDCNVSLTSVDGGFPQPTWK